MKKEGMKKRSANYTNQEKEELLRIISKYPIVENKHTDGASVQEKNTAWDAICMEYNSLGYTLRNTKHLRHAYNNFKRKGISQGEAPPPRLLAIEQFQPFQNSLDSDGGYHTVENNDLDERNYESEAEMAKRRYYEFKLEAAKRKDILETKLLNLNIQIAEQKLANMSQ